MERTCFRCVLPSVLGAASLDQRLVPENGPDVDHSHDTFAALLLAIAGHDLRQPLQVITNAHDLLESNVQSTQQRQEVERAKNATAQLARMLSQLIEALHLQERPREDLIGPVMLRPILDELAKEFAEPARRKRIILRVTTARHTAMSNPVLLTSMLRNLIRNAIDYTPPGGRVLLVTCHRAPDLRIKVCDTGNGLRACTFATVFDAFQRSDGSRTNGLGLGLFIVKCAADLLGHRVEVQSVKGRGSLFTIVAPAAF